MHGMDPRVDRICGGRLDSRVGAKTGPSAEPGQGPEICGASGFLQASVLVFGPTDHLCAPARSMAGLRLPISSCAGPRYWANRVCGFRNLMRCCLSTSWIIELSPYPNHRLHGDRFSAAPRLQTGA